MQEIFIEVRTRGIPVLSYIDDGITADFAYEKCLWAVVLIVKLLNYLGAYFGLPKCHLKPSQQGKWLGFEVVTKLEEFRVSSKKMNKVLPALSHLLASSVAEKLISLLPGRPPSLPVLERVLPSNTRKAQLGRSLPVFGSNSERG
jgi:hypothetical protein